MDYIFLRCLQLYTTQSFIIKFANQVSFCFKKWHFMSWQNISMMPQLISLILNSGKDMNYQQLDYNFLRCLWHYTTQSFIIKFSYWVVFCCKNGTSCNGKTPPWCQCRYRLLWTVAKTITIGSWIMTFIDVYDFTLLNHLFSNLPNLAKHLQDVTPNIAPSEQWQRH